MSGHVIYKVKQTQLLTHAAVETNEHNFRYDLWISQKTSTEDRGVSGKVCIVRLVI